MHNTFNVTLRKKVKLPWIDNETLRAMELRNHLYDETRDPQINDVQRQQKMEAFRRQKNVVTAMLRRKRNEFIENHVQASLHNSRKMWQVMKMILRKNVSNQNDGLPKSIETDGGDEIQDPREILNEMNKHFVEIGCKLNEQMKALNNDKPRTPQFLFENRDSILLHDTDQGELYKIIRSLKNDAACGLDGISSKNLRTLASELSSSLVRPINEAMRNGTFPEAFKEARVRALYKGKGSRKKCTNYRPISILSNVSKITRNYCTHDSIGF